MADEIQADNPTLEATIKRASRALTEHNDYLRGNETATRALIIDVVLGGLGWDIRNPERVRLEHRVNGNNKVDYALFSAPSKILAVVEAKAVDVALSGRNRRDATGYAVDVGAHYAVLTNGGRWEAWAMEPGPRKENIFVEVNLTTGDVSDIAESLRRLSRSELGR